MAKNTLDYYFFKEIKAQPGGEGITKCLSCGTCTSICQVHSVNNEYNPRKLIQMAVLGLKEEVINSELLWICARCNNCTEVCPKGIRPQEIINAIRHAALSEKSISNKGKRHSEYFKKSILSTGKINEAMLPLYTLRTNIIFQIPQSIKMFFKGKLPPLFPHKIKGLKDLELLNNLIEQRRGKK